VSTEKKLKKWETLDKTPLIRDSEKIINILLKNRGIKGKKEKEEFFNPKNPLKIGLKELGIDKKALGKAIRAVKSVVKKNQMIVIYGDYDVDGICGTGILFETLYAFTKNVHPHLPDRFSEGYGLNPSSVKKLKEDHPSLGLIVTVDNGISAFEGIKKAEELRIGIIICDHHHKKGRTPKCIASLYTNKISGAAIAWIFAREIRKTLKIKSEKLKRGDGLELAALGTIADQMPLIGLNRSFAWHGITALRETTRPGLLALYKQSGISKEIIGSYEVNYIIAPRLNAAGRLEHALNSLRLICTPKYETAKELAEYLGRVNAKRQKILEETFIHARDSVGKVAGKKILVLAHETYHEGVIGLAASKLVEEFHRPAILIAKGKEEAKGSGRSIPGFNLFEALSRLNGFPIRWGGHKMAAGFTISSEDIEIFSKKIEKIADELLKEEDLRKRLRIDAKINFSAINLKLVEEIRKFEPTGVGNPTPTFSTKNVKIVNASIVGRDRKHLKLLLEESGITFSAIAFGQGDLFSNLSPKHLYNIAYTLSLDEWNDQKRIELKIKDIKS